MQRLVQERVQAVEEHGIKGVVNNVQHTIIHVHAVIRPVILQRCVAVGHHHSVDQDKHKHRPMPS